MTEGIIIMTEEDERQSDKGRFLSKIEDLAVDLFQDTGMKVKTISFTWKKKVVKEEDRMTEDSGKEFNYEIETHHTEFN